MAQSFLRPCTRRWRDTGQSLAHHVQVDGRDGAWTRTAEPVERKVTPKEPAAMAITVAFHCVEGAPAPAGEGTAIEATLDRAIPTTSGKGVALAERSLGSPGDPGAGGTLNLEQGAVAERNPAAKRNQNWSEQCWHPHHERRGANPEKPGNSTGVLPEEPPK